MKRHQTESLRNLAKEYGISHEAVRRALKATGTLQDLCSVEDAENKNCSSNSWSVDRLVLGLVGTISVFANEGSNSNYHSLTGAAQASQQPRITTIRAEVLTFTQLRGLPDIEH